MTRSTGVPSLPRAALSLRRALALLALGGAALLPLGSAADAAPRLPAPAAADPSPGSSPVRGSHAVGALRRQVVRLHRRARGRALRLVLPAPPPLRLARRPEALRAQVRRLRHVHRQMTERSGGRTGVALASAYSASDAGSQQGCPGAPTLRDEALSVATFLVPCGGRLRICRGSRCVTAVRHDSGPYVGGREIDLNIGVVRALGVSSIYSWGVAPVRWRALPAA